MSWDPTDLQISNVEALADLHNAMDSALVTLQGQNFKAQITHAAFVRVGSVHSREHTIPCAVEANEGGVEAELSFCPFRKTAGVYDLIVWRDPPPKLEFGGAQFSVVAADVIVAPLSLEIREATEKEWEEAHERIKNKTQSGQGGEVEKPKI